MSKLREQELDVQLTRERVKDLPLSREEDVDLTKYVETRYLSKNKTLNYRKIKL